MRIFIWPIAIHILYYSIDYIICTCWITYIDRSSMAADAWEIMATALLRYAAEHD
ncbi:MAG TPA: hypothetical protein VK211_11015 [Kamptonema sp.]|nr:hypothetical protein [Kamptonema sp.]